MRDFRYLMTWRWNLSTPYSLISYRFFYNQMHLIAFNHWHLPLLVGNNLKMMWSKSSVFESLRIAHVIFIMLASCNYDYMVNLQRLLQVIVFKVPYGNLVTPIFLSKSKFPFRYYKIRLIIIHKHLCHLCGQSIEALLCLFAGYNTYCNRE